MLLILPACSFSANHTDNEDLSRLIYNFDKPNLSSSFSGVYSIAEEPDVSKSFGKQALHDLGSSIATGWSDAKYVYSSPSRWTATDYYKLATIFGIGGVIYAYDQEIADALKRNADHPAYKPFKDLGEFLEPAGYMGFTNKYFFGALALGYILHLDKVTEISGDILSSYAIGAPVKFTANQAFGRRRPAAGYGPYNFKPGDGTSLPSGHTLNVTELARIICYHTDSLPIEIAAWVGAASVGFQRITSDSHWPSDVFLAASYGFYLTGSTLKRKAERQSR